MAGVLLLPDVAGKGNSGAEARAYARFSPQYIYLGHFNTTKLLRYFFSMILGKTSSTTHLQLRSRWVHAMVDDDICGCASAGEDELVSLGIAGLCRESAGEDEVSSLGTVGMYRKSAGEDEG